MEALPVVAIYHCKEMPLQEQDILISCSLSPSSQSEYMVCKQQEAKLDILIMV
jgi:hypothetical protein